ncbi:olfactory receptor 5AR1-like [Ambystoma mexicanum]|uniref:olfactory receptor 5AR1-like n=1 Tax=Ambystoma mexicanum TaxID=8296 RepID=UPI0037E95570
MNKGNWSSMTEFILLGLTDDPQLQVPLFVLFLLIYIITLLGNAAIITLIKISPSLNTTMYFLLSNLSFVDLCYSSTITPNMVANCVMGRKVISLAGCVTQLFSFVVFGTAESLLLSVMAYDRYSAICHPLLYSVIMSEKVCMHLLISVYVCGVLHSMAQTGFIFRLSFCGPKEISHFFCDVPPLLRLSCSDTSFNEVLMLACSITVALVSICIILTSYVYIILTIMRIPSSLGRHQAFSTCSSHLICVSLFYCTGLLMYLSPNSSRSLHAEGWPSVFYTVVIPMLNPIIYSLRNQDVKMALTKWIQKQGKGAPRSGNLQHSRLLCPSSVDLSPQGSDDTDDWDHCSSSQTWLQATAYRRMLLRAVSSDNAQAHKTEVKLPQSMHYDARHAGRQPINSANVHLCSPLSYAPHQLGRYIMYSEHLFECTDDCGIDEPYRLDLGIPAEHIHSY